MPEGTETRILHLITRFKSGGAETTVQRTLEALDSSDRDYELFLGTGVDHDPSRLSEIESTGVQTVVFSLIRHYNPFTAVFSVVSVAWFLYRKKIDIIHTHSTEAGIIGRLAAWIVGTDVVIHEIHGDPIAEDHHRILNFTVLRLERLCSRMTDVFVAKSEVIRDTYLSRGIGQLEDYKIIYHGIVVDDFCRPAKELENDDSITLLYVGRIASGKGIEDLIRAVKKVECDSLTVRIAGEGPDMKQLKQITEELGVSPTISFLGYRDDIPALLADANVLVLPSYREGTPRVITEALASGTPVISTRIAGIPDQVKHGETGVLIEPGDIPSLVNQIEEVCKHPKHWKKMGMKGREDIERFRLDNIQSAWEQLYADLVATEISS